MQRSLLVRPLTDTERETLTAGLRCRDAFRLRRCQILLASARGETTTRIAQRLGLSEQAVRNALKAFNQQGLAALVRGSSRPKTIHAAFEVAAAERLRELLHRSPREFGKSTSVWTLPLVAEVSLTEGLTAGSVSGETVRATLQRLGVRWQRAKQWLTSPDPAYARKKGGAIG